MKKIIIISIIIFILIITSTNAITLLPNNTHRKQNNTTYNCTNVKVLGSNSVVISSFPPQTKEDIITSIPYPQPVGNPDNLPSYFNWKDNNGDWTTPAKIQGSCGSCWAFSAIGALEAAINIASHNPNTDIDLSEQYVLSCLSSAGNCNGGWMHNAIEAIYSTSHGSSGNNINGCTIESCMPYRADDNVPCSSKSDNWNYIDPYGYNSKLWQIRDWGWTESFIENSESDWNTIKTWIINYGPLAVDIYASDGLYNYWDIHHSKNDVYEQDDSGMTNHGVVLIGWKNDIRILNGGYWIFKNSWFPSWGYDNNFFNVAYGCLGVATRDCTWVTTPVWSGEGNNQYNYISSYFSFTSLYPKPGDTVHFKDKSSGKIALYEWDFNNDNITDSNEINPSYTFSDTGEYPIKLTVWNEKGLSSTYTQIVSVKTVWKPIAVATPEYYSSKNPKVNFDGSLSWDIDGSIIKYEWNTDNGDIIYGEKPTYTFPTNIGRIYNVTLTITDNDGSTDTCNCDIRMDINIPPVTTLSTEYGNTKQKYFKNPVTMCLLPDDWTGIKNSYYRINPTSLNQNFITYSEPFRLWNEGIYNIDFYSVDIYGNQEEIKSEQIIIDFTPPTLNSPILSGKLVNEHYETPVTITLNGHDSGINQSGVDKILYVVDNNEIPLSQWNIYNNSFIISENGTHNLQTCIYDKAGNMFISDPLQIKIQIKDYPSVKIIKPSIGIYIKNEKILPSFSKSIIFGSINIVVDIKTPYDNIHPKYVEFYIDNILCYTDTTSPFEWIWNDNFGVHTIIAKVAVDGYANMYTDKTTAIKLI